MRQAPTVVKKILKKNLVLNQHKTPKQSPDKNGLRPDSRSRRDSMKYRSKTQTISEKAKVSVNPDQLISSDFIERILKAKEIDEKNE